MQRPPSSFLNPEPATEPAPILALGFRGPYSFSYTATGRSGSGVQEASRGAHSGGSSALRADSPGGQRHRAAPAYRHAGGVGVEVEGRWRARVVGATHHAVTRQ